MKMKKIALRGLIVVAICVALCMFFSGTIENIMTPKVKIAKATQGKLVETLELSASLSYPDTQEERLTLPSGQTLNVVRVNVRPGYAVKAGDVVLEMRVSGYENAVKLAQDEYDAALDDLMELERKNEGLTLRRSDQAYAESYASLRTASQALANKKTDMEVLLRAEKLTLPSEGAPEGASEALTSAISAYREAEALRDAAQAEFNRAARYGVSEEVWAYISAKQSAQEKLDACAEKRVSLEELNRAAAAICAPHDGYIADIVLKAGDTYDGNAPLYRITAPDAAPALRAELGDTDKNISEGTKLSVELDSGTVDAKITGTGFTDTGAKYVEVRMNDDMLRASKNLFSLSQSGAKLHLSFKSPQSSCLLPAAAVRGGEDSRYVYIINERSTTFGKRKLSISKMDVTLIAEADGVASVEQDLGYYNIAYMEDRALREGGDVMEYVE